jgi:two-component system heavy metal sensor histidine kinase CusS
MMTRLLRSISLRISLIFTFFTALILLIMGMFIHQLVMHHFEEEDRIMLEGKLELIENILQQNPQNGSAILQQLNDALVGHPGLMVQVERPVGVPLLITLHARVPDSPKSWTKQSLLTEWIINQQHYRGRTVTHVATSMSASDRIVVGIQTAHHTDFLNQFRQELLWIGSIGTLCLMLLGWFAARRGLRPAQSMAQVAEGISGQHLDKRLDLERAPTELRPLAIAFNDMLDRLEDALARLSYFSSDLAHELRTPINRLMTQTQVCLSKPRDNEIYKEVLFSNLEEYERLARMTADMLFLAKADHGLVLTSLQKVDLSLEIAALFEFYEALAADKGVHLVQTGEASIQGDQLMLRRAFSNLISNAIRYGQTDSVISISMRHNEEFESILIENEASSIPPEQLSRLFDRFYRTDSSRKQTDEGAGLGLAITKSIVQAHQGQIQAFSAHGKVSFQIKFPHQL